MKDYSKQFTTSEITRLEARLDRKRKNAMTRGIECDLTIEDMYMMGAKLLGHGCCDYTGMAFNLNIASDANPTTGKDPRYPTMERIDDSKGYVRGNVCVVMRRANELKDNLIDKKTATTIIEPLDREMVQAMMLNMSREHLEQLKAKYIPESEETETPINPIKEEETIMAQPEIKITVGATVEEAVAAIEETVVQKEQDLPDDVRTAQEYMTYSKTFAKLGIPVKATFLQFKSKYSKKVCPLSALPLSFENKAILLLDRPLGLIKDNFLIVDKKYAAAVNGIMDKTSMSFSELKDMFNKVV